MSYTSALFTSARYHTSREARDPNYRVLTAASINKSVLEAQYAVRGAIPLRAEELREELEHKGKDAGLPFDEIVSCNIGNPQQLDQKPLTFLRQVSSSSSPSSSWLDSTPTSPLAQRACAHLQNDALTLSTPCSPRSQISALTEYPDLISHPLSKEIFPSDALERARSLLEEIGSTGAYSHSMGVPSIRKRVAKFIAGASRSRKTCAARRAELTLPPTPSRRP